jgi:hypothetical protein
MDGWIIRQNESTHFQHLNSMAEERAIEKRKKKL